MTKEEIEKIDALFRKASKGKWVVPKIGPGIWVGPLLENTLSCCRAALSGGELFIVDPGCSGYADRFEDEDDAERQARRDLKLCAALHNAWPAIREALLAKVDP